MLFNNFLIGVAVSTAASALPAESFRKSIGTPLTKRRTATNADGTVKVDFLRNQVSSAIA